MLQVCECIFCRDRPLKGLILLGQGCEGCRDCRVPLNEASVEVCQAKEGLYFLDSLGLRLLKYGLYFGFVHLGSFWCVSVSEEVDCRDVKFTFLQLNVKPRLVQCFQDLSHMYDVVLQV